MSDYVQLEMDLELPCVVVRVLPSDVGPSGECEVVDISATWVKVKMKSVEGAGGVWVKWEAVHPEDWEKLYSRLRQKNVVEYWLKSR